jgi:ATP-dependent Lhr-like helicase
MAAHANRAPDEAADEEGLDVGPADMGGATDRTATEVAALLQARDVDRREQLAARGVDAAANEATFDRYAPFIQRAIWNAGWEALRPAQIACAQAILDGRNDVLITTPTASGKTEAWAFPVLTDIGERARQSVKVVYVSPVKALINDQAWRLQPLCEAGDIPLHLWHQDITQAHKDRMVQTPGGVLMTTPESLESILGNRRDFVHQLFADLEYAVIDEVHSLAASDRGIQVGVQLHRLSAIARGRVRVIALSATVGDTAMMRAYVSPHAPDQVEVVAGQLGMERRTLYRHDHFRHAGATLPVGAVRAVYQRTAGRRAIAFNPTRRAVEELAAKLNAIAQDQGNPMAFLAHHSSLSKQERERVEGQMRTALQPTGIVATSTLELGIDIGDLDLVVDVNATPTVAGRRQRRGRTGRQDGQDQILYAITTDGLSDRVLQTRQTVVDRIPWRLLHNAAVADLDFRDRWSEAPRPPQAAVHVLAQQMLQILKQERVMTPAELRDRLLDSGRFEAIRGATIEVDGEQRSVAGLLFRHLMATGLIRRAGDRGSEVRVGESADRIVNHYDGLSVFQESLEFTVSDGPRRVGSIAARRIHEGERFVLAGRPWMVTGVDERRRHLSVQLTDRGEAEEWHGDGGPEVAEEVVQRARDILLGRFEPLGTLGPETRASLDAARQLAARYGFGDRTWFPSLRRHRQGPAQWWGESGGMWVPWRGSRAVDSALAALSAAHLQARGADDEARRRRGQRRRELDIPWSDLLAPWRIVFRCDGAEVLRLAHRALELTPRQIAQSLTDGSIVNVKFAEYLPRPVLEHRWLTDCYEEGTAREILGELVRGIETRGAADPALAARRLLLPVPPARPGGGGDVAVGPAPVPDDEVERRGGDADDVPAAEAARQGGGGAAEEVRQIVETVEQGLREQELGDARAAAVADELNAQRRAVGPVLEQWEEAILRPDEARLPDGLVAPDHVAEPGGRRRAVTTNEQGAPLETIDRQADAVQPCSPAQGDARDPDRAGDGHGAPDGVDLEAAPVALVDAGAAVDETSSLAQDGR